MLWRVTRRRLVVRGLRLERGADGRDAGAGRGPGRRRRGRARQAAQRAVARRLPRLPRQRRHERPRVHGAAALDRSRSGGAARRAAAARDDHAADAARRAPARHAAAGALRARRRASPAIRGRGPPWATCPRTAATATTPTAPSPPCASRCGCRPTPTPARIERDDRRPGRPHQKWDLPHSTPGTTSAVKPGAPDLSALCVRMRSRRPSSQMPPLGTTLADGDAVDLVSAWIDELGRRDVAIRNDSGVVAR